MSKVPSFENTNKPDKPDGDVTRNYCIFVTHLTYEDLKQHFELVELPTIYRLVTKNTVKREQSKKNL